MTAEEAINKFLRITGKVIYAFQNTCSKRSEKSRGKIVCITHFKKSPLTVYSDEILLCGAEESPLEGGSMSAKMGQLYLIDLLYQEYYAKNYEISRENNKKTSTAVVEKLY